MLDLNSSFIWIFFLIWLLYLILNRIFFKPINEIITARETKISADSNRQESMVAEIETRTGAIEAQLSQARKEAQQIKEGLLKNGEEIRSRTVTSAKEQAGRVLDEKMSQLESEIVAAENTLEMQISVFSDKIKQAYL
ncbi:MAG: ATP synthase F0 subunit B [Candidatus Aminicenantes bacterium]|jgi:F-type H+-transporting ATPase subunit b|nr:ATP synthase F0 subunit B [Candidatus Aminicenantes bacterium]